MHSRSAWSTYHVYIEKLKTQKKKKEKKKNQKQLRAPVAIAEDLGSVPNITGYLTTISNSSPKRPNALFWCLWAPGTHVVHRHT